jgi:hypothetical protein
MMSMSPQEQELRQLLTSHVSTIRAHVADHYELAKGFPDAPFTARNAPVVSVKEVQRCFLPHGTNYEDGEIEFVVFLSVSVDVSFETKGIKGYDCNAVLHGRVVKTEEGGIGLTYVGNAAVELPTRSGWRS